MSILHLLAIVGYIMGGKRKVVKCLVVSLIGSGIAISLGVIHAYQLGGEHWLVPVFPMFLFGISLNELLRLRAARKSNG